MPRSPRPAGQQSLADRVYRKIRDGILTRELQPDAMLDEHALAKRYGVSRTPVREALLRLEHEGLVVTIPRRGTFVRRPTLQDLIEIDQIRRLLEPAAARMAAGHVNADALAEIEGEFIRMQSTGSKDVAWFLRVDASLHELILRSSGNTLLQQVVTALHDRTRAVSPLAPADRVPAAVAEVRLIIDALRIGDALAAEEAMRTHLRASMENRLRVQAAGFLDGGPEQRPMAEFSLVSIG